MSNSVFLIDDEDMIIAKNEREMKRIYAHYHGQSIRGRNWRLVPPSEMVPLTNGDDEEYEKSAAEIGQNPSQYIAAQ